MVTSGIIACGTSIATSYASGVNPFTGDGQKWNPITGRDVYPKNNGGKGKSQTITLQKGQIIDRYGDEKGRYLSPVGTPDQMRSLHPGTDTKSYNVYEVVKPFKVDAGTAAPFYGKPGGGIQYYSTKTVNQLKMDGYIKPVSASLKKIEPIIGRMVI